MHKVSFIATHRENCQREGRVQKSCLKKELVCGSGKISEGIAAAILVLSHSHTLKFEGKQIWAHAVYHGSAKKQREEFDYNCTFTNIRDQQFEKVVGKNP